MGKRSEILNALFVSKVRIKTLKFFLLNPDRSMHLRGLVRELDEEINAVRRELMRLESSGILISTNKGNRKYFKADKNNIFFNDLLGFIHKTYGLGGEIIKQKSKLGNVSFAILTSSFTRNLQSYNQPIDLMIIGEVDLTVLHDIVKKYEESLGKEIHYSVMSLSEFNIRKKRRDEFVYNIILQENIFLIGTFDDLIKKD